MVDPTNTRWQEYKVLGILNDVKDPNRAREIAQKFGASDEMIASLNAIRTEPGSR